MRIAHIICLIDKEVFSSLYLSILLNLILISFFLLILVLGVSLLIFMCVIRVRIGLEAIISALFFLIRVYNQSRRSVFDQTGTTFFISLIIFLYSWTNCHLMVVLRNLAAGFWFLLVYLVFNFMGWRIVRLHIFPGKLVFLFFHDEIDNQRILLLLHTKCLCFAVFFSESLIHRFCLFCHSELSRWFKALLFTVEAPFRHWPERTWFKCAIRAPRSKHQRNCWFG